MQVVIKPSALGGKLSLPTSKSMGHRIMICRYLASGEISTEGLTLSKDIYATARALEGLSSGLCNCGESGSTLRFLMPIALARGGEYTFTGEGRLMQRPMDTYKDIFTRMGISWSSRGDKITVDGKLKSGHYILDDPVSSQYVTGLLLALPLLDGDSVITLSQKLESSSYVDITQSVQNKFGVFSLKTLSGYEVRGNQQYKNSHAVAEPDASQAAFWLVANKLGSNIAAEIPENTVQGDGVILKLLKNNITDIDITDCPDLAPVLAVWLSQTGGALRNCKRLRYKESDRFNAICQMLQSLGGEASALGQDIIIKKTVLKGGVVDSFNDHRIAMAAAIAATVATGDVTITNGECVEKSYPDFWKDYVSLGGKISECNPW